MSENKKEFIAALETALRIDQGRNNVEKIRYLENIDVDDDGGQETIRYEEIVRIDFASGAYKLINVTANSNGANAQQIIKAVYGGEPIGLLFSGFEEEEED